MDASTIVLGGCKATMDLGSVSSGIMWVQKSGSGTSTVDVNPNGLSEGEIPLTSSGVPVTGAKMDKGSSEPVEFIES
jgi:hypothetical protein